MSDVFITSSAALNCFSCQDEEEGKRQRRGHKRGGAGAEGQTLFPVWGHGSRTEGLSRVPPPQTEGHRSTRYHKICLTDFEDELRVASASAYLASCSSPATHMVRTIVSSQSIPIPQTAADCPGRTRQPSECVSMTVRLDTWVSSSALIKTIQTFSYLYASIQIQMI